MPITVNLFDTDLDRPELVKFLADSLAARDIPSNLLELEVIEADLAAHSHTHGTVLAALRAVGMRVSIDDFGSGCATLMRLHDLPADGVKINGTLVSGMFEDAITEQVVTGLIQIGHAAGLTVTAQGVDNGELWEHLDDLGCDLIQGQQLAQQWGQAVREAGRHLDRRPLPTDRRAEQMAPDSGE